MNPRAFVIMPFYTEFDEVYEYLIKGALDEAGYEVFRADDLLNQSNILSDIVNSIGQSDLIVADLTAANPNVYYELGLAHSLRKPVILLCQDIGEVPFDLRSYRVIPYSTHFSKMHVSKTELVKTAVACIEGKIVFGNPITDFLRADYESQKSASVRGSTERVPEGEKGVLDLSVDLEDGMEELTKIIESVGEGMIKLTPLMIDSAGFLKSEASAKQKRKAVRDLAQNMQNYGVNVKKRNAEYREVLDKVGSSLDSLLSGEYSVEEDQIEGLKQFMDTLEDVEENAFKGRQGFAELVRTMESLPKIEKQFNRANKFMAGELKEFISNIDQLISVLTRARTAAKGLIDSKSGASNQ